MPCLVTLKVADYEARQAELLEALDGARRTADMSLGKASDMAQRLESLEVAAPSHAPSPSAKAPLSSPFSTHLRVVEEGL